MRMSLHRKALLIIAITIVSSLFLVYTAARIIVLGSFRTLEDQQTRQYVEQARSALFDEIASLDAFVVDWAMWDDTYEFVEDANRAYILSNLPDATFRMQRLNLVMFVNSAAQVVFGKAFDPDRKREIPVPQSIQEHLTPGAPLVRHLDSKNRAAGIVLLPEGAAMVASRPILTSQQTGPIRGSLIMGRMLSAAEILRLSTLTHLSLQMYLLNDADLPADVRQIQPALSREHPIAVQPFNEASIAGYALVEDIYGKPCLIIRVDIFRAIFQQGQSSVLYFVSSVFVTGILLSIIALLLLEKMIISRLARLSANVSRINTRNDLSKRVIVDGSDELASLARTINDMLAALENSQGELWEIHERFRRLSEATFEGIAIHDSEHVLDVNQAMVTLFGYPLPDLVGKDLLELIAPESREMVSQHIQAEYESSYEAKGQRADGSMFFAEIQSKTMPYQKMRMRGTAIRDITWRKMAEEALRHRTREMTVLNHMSGLLQACHTEEETYSVIGNVGRLLFPLDSGSLWILDAPRTTLKSVTFWGTPPSIRTIPAEQCQALRQGESVFLEHADAESGCPYIREAGSENGNYLCMLISASGEILGIFSLLLDPRKPDQSEEAYTRMREAKQSIALRVTTHYALSLTNLRLREALRKEAIRDPLTDLYNRRYMEESLKQEVQRAKRMHTPVGIMLFDIDHFKLLNDTHGHKAGDAVLQALSALVRRSIRGGDIACRYGGEEFLVILPDANLEITTLRANELLAHIRALTVTYQDKILQITASIGVSVLIDYTADIQEVIKAADMALYQAKTGGRNQVVAASKTEEQ